MEGNRDNSLRQGFSELEKEITSHYPPVKSKTEKVSRQ